MNGDLITRPGPAMARGFSGLLVLLTSLVLVGAVEGQEKRELRHILVKSEAMADALMKEIGKGADFKELARKYSLDTGTRPLGGDLGWASPGDFEPAFAQAAFAIPNKGEMAKVKTRFGWHVIEFIDSRPAPGTPPAPPAGDTPTPPAETPPVMPERNSDLSVAMKWERTAFHSGEEMRFSIELKNESDGELEIWSPRLWPLGMLVRYQFGPGSPNLSIPESWGEGGPPGGWFRRLAPGESLREQFRLQDYFGECSDWPIVRMIWRGDVLHRRLLESYPTLAERQDWPTRQGRWRFYVTEESRVSILPAYSAKDRWFLCIFSQGKTWIEIHDPGVPNLMDELIDDVRREVYTDQVIGDYQPADHYVLGAGDDDVPVGFMQPPTAIQWKEGVVGLGLTWEGRTPFIGSTIAFGLENPSTITSRAVPFGRIVLEEGDPSTRIKKLLGAGQLARASLVLAYPAALVPAEVLAAADALPDPGRIRRKLDPTPKKEFAPQLTRRDERATPQEKVPDRSERDIAPPPVRKDSARVELVTSAGSIVIMLYEDDAPNTVASFLDLVERGLYDGTHVVRKVTTDHNRGFVQLGSPDDTAGGHRGFTIEDEVNARPHLTGVVSMARKHTEPDSAGCQFFICIDGQPHLDKTYTTFGEIIAGLDVAEQLTEADRIVQARVQRKPKQETEPRRTPIAGE
jgi:peptidyl-prolyl cis-trans isomerase B (cyclophilin B)